MTGPKAAAMSMGPQERGHDRGRELLRWGACLIAVLAVHAAGAATILDWSKPAPPMAAPPPAIMIDLGDAQPAPPPPPPQQVAIEPPRPTPAIEPPTPPQPESPKVEVPKVESEVALDQVKPKPPEAQKKKKKKREKPKPAEAPPPPVPVKPVEDSKETAQVPIKPAEQAQAQSEAAEAAKKEAEMASLAAAMEAQKNWESQVSAHLISFKRSPRMRHHRPMTAYIDVAIDRQGQILSRAVAQSSGDHRLDDAALALVDRANPLPPPPAEYDETRLHAIKLPIVFMPK
ncbi:energy transducer TonB [Dongia soli]|uniref:Energy transducer TonB n=1 Tax=Dongia soli TaxID=600628 RepID=A0ABU5E5T7_9PROT|nr:energy transducer TonB [Dongia soli]MDY0881573.1 energy transducer TonB [Dongia soli]